MKQSFAFSRLGLALPPVEPGWVWLVGAGPGDPGLLTVLAAHALAEADVVVHDALIDGRVLGLAREEAVLIPAGKRGGRPSHSQPDISARLVDLARAGKRVVRLKGGDPFVFGRGAEEARTLVAAGVPFRIVPGVTAGVGGLAYAGIPATTRDTNATVTFVTGHAATGEVPDTFDWEALARLPVLVFYMALKTLDVIAARLMEHGRSGETPVAFVSDATTAAQRVHITTLAQAVTERDRLGIAPPALVVLGDVVPLARDLAWWSPPKQGCGGEVWPDPMQSIPGSATPLIGD
ncbi:uroporphyrinogen-III C-methyltransferase [Rhodospirillum rubrum]|uniref:uroporphyrinogen-III C-methyltransferase n=1 Tax=Rhodospirillum rubrum (strain ATCC 11170 / ATH 1.1.1 / DSM 467 / LMG 4362 / NCIMB 8255 / S1) TaxID=269796 RepID=Q2RNY9_RHORT|nr:uroporphyrinogen-III C-methyltransferase [Rhodospirillum rubrum]ABC24156.1 uroporphyrinogen-III C-methyltransferase [Rhodospirillum rubrum ATCC 11170]AEO49907.1 uroporphyrinogen-III C-methyltransferase [Rhodospirillum rubrum F11]MBK1663110.1 uroporphyrinogen-III C-methyltransferase [Rhodospirillum rubrum]MBK1675721.1 uroporphyrinogen-III C-methyltransferase [Rhodospirillum rubrum]MBK5955869.1 uroporphyrinogen-III C-methyltransferase [Rhodospirillum rubrum]